MPSDDRPRVLCVDDDASVLQAFARNLRREFDLETATDAMAALELMERSEPFAVAVSDLRMPGMSGVEFLEEARTVSPDTVRILLTGYADIESAISAVNRGNIFRLLTKPCPPELLTETLKAAAEQYRLITSERVLLEQTLQGSIRTLSEILALVHPAAFGRATRVREYVREMLDHSGPAERWPVEVAAMLSQIGCVTLPPQTAHKLYHNEALTGAEQQMVDRLPQVTESLLRNIPRLEPVRAILRLYPRRFETVTSRQSTEESAAVQWGSSALKIAIDYDAVEARGATPADALSTLRGRAGWYDPAMLEAFAKARGGQTGNVIREVRAADVELGMVFAEDVRTAKGMLLISRGHEVTPSLLERIRNFSATVGLKEPIHVAQPGGVLSSAR
jgi:ActR/RegA family two-component response regulator